VNYSSATYLSDFKTGEISPCRFSNALGATLRHLFNGRNGFEFAGFDELQQIQKLLALTG
jgi:hypothetical protein